MKPALAAAAVVAAAAVAATPASSTDNGPGCVAGEIPVGYLVPRGANAGSVWVVPPGGGTPRQVVVDWGTGVAVWQCGPPTRTGSLWRRLYRSHFAQWFFPQIQFGDLTLDDHPEVLIELGQGSGDVGPRVVLDTLHVPARVIWHRTTGNTQYEIRSHALILEAGVYTWHDAHCCPTFRRRTVWRWKRGGLRPVASGLYAALYSHSSGPLHFKPSSAIFWDGQRGAAIGGTHPWLLGRTTDGGKTWRIVDASPVPLVNLARTAPGRATVRFVHCGSSCDVPVASTSDYGTNWSPEYGWPLIQVGRG